MTALLQRVGHVTDSCHQRGPLRLFRVHNEKINLLFSLNEEFPRVYQMHGISSDSLYITVT